jgi:hypothetical protein
MSSRITRALVVAATIAVAAGTGQIASAHHSFAAFDMTAEKTITGVVKKVVWTNPHIWIWVDVTESSGTTATYGFEGMTPNFLSRRGWTRSSMQPGMKVSVTFRPMKDGKPGGMFVSGTLPDGNVLTMRGGETGQ